MNRRRFLKTAGATAALSAVAPAAAAPDPSRDVCLMSGRELARLIRTRELSAREVMAAHLQRIARVNPRINAIVAKLDDDACLALADEAARRRPWPAGSYPSPTAATSVAPCGIPRTSTTSLLFGRPWGWCRRRPACTRSAVSR